MKVGFEWLVDAAGCDAESLRDAGSLNAVFDRVILDLGLKTIGNPVWHKFAGEGGLTGFVMLTESHLTCHTYPEHGTATFNLYCCRQRPEWDWSANLMEMIGAREVNVTVVERGAEDGSATFAAGGEA